MVSGPNLNETSIVSGGYGGAAEGIIPTSSIKGNVAHALWCWRTDKPLPWRMNLCWQNWSSSPKRLFSCEHSNGHAFTSLEFIVSVQYNTDSGILSLLWRGHSGHYHDLLVCFGQCDPFSKHQCVLLCWLCTGCFVGTEHSASCCSFGEQTTGVCLLSIFLLSIFGLHVAWPFFVFFVREVCYALYIPLTLLILPMLCKIDRFTNIILSTMSPQRFKGEMGCELVNQSIALFFQGHRVISVGKRIRNVLQHGPNSELGTNTNWMGHINLL